MAINLKDVNNLTLDQAKTGLKAKIDTFTSFANKNDIITLSELLDDLIAGKVFYDLNNATKVNDVAIGNELK